MTVSEHLLTQASKRPLLITRENAWAMLQLVKQQEKKAGRAHIRAVARQMREECGLPASEALR